MLADRLKVVIILIPIGVGVIALGGIPYTIAVVVILGLAAWEYVNLFRKGGMAPSMALVVSGVVALTLQRAWMGFAGVDIALSILTLLAIVFHMVAYERGAEHAATDFGVTLGGILYIGWLGAYLVSLRFLPDGLWWVLLVLPSVWLADGGAYFIGRRFGRHPLTQRLSPNKTWEGYLGGVVTGMVSGLLLAALWSSRSPAMTPLRGALVGFILAVETPLGDLGESMLKRQFGVKDASHLIPGHGGVLDRIDTWLWAGVIGYYLAIWVWPS
ncbi:MAG TPA: phosphatidate cytidylyltransferase [Anaerolineaceae bacterium]|nr:phosphatidate cytidylyltransferase [Anaerolineaceae bacterium]